MDELKKYLKDAIGFEGEIKTVAPEKLKMLPLFIASEYEFQQMKLFGLDILLVFVQHTFTTERLKKHLEIIKVELGIIPVAIINKLEPYNRIRLIEKKIPFIIPNKQMYLPDLLIDLKEFGNKPRELPQLMQPAAQLLLLYHLQVESLEGINLKGIAEKLFYNGMTITRAAVYLHHAGLCTLTGVKEKTLHFDLDKKYLWEKAEPLMHEPVKKTSFYNGWIPKENVYKSNYTALAHYTDLNQDIIQYYAVRPGYTKFLEGANLKKTGINEGDICIEEWKYNPFLLNQTGFVDTLSLYLQFRNKQDERIEMALAQMIEKFPW